jgi:two-component system, sensor histidine kinase PdtaS
MYFPSDAQIRTRKQVDSFYKLLSVSKLDTNRISILWELGKYHLFKSGVYKNDIDSALGFFKHTVLLSDSIHQNRFKYESLCRLGETYFKDGELQKGRNCFQEVILAYQKDHDKPREARTWFRFAYKFPDYSPAYPEIISLLNKALDIYKQLDNKERMLEVRLVRGYLYIKLNNYDLAQKEFLLIIDSSVSLGIHKLPNKFIYLSKIYQYKGNLSQAIYYGLKAVQTMQEYRDSTGFYEGVPVYANIADLYRQLGMKKESMFWYKKAFEGYQLSPTPLGSGAYMYNFAADFAQLSSGQNESREALSILNGLTREHIPYSPLEKVFHSAAMAFIMVTRKNVKAADSYLQDMIKNVRNRDILLPELVGDAYFDIGRLFLIQKKFEKAGQFLSIYQMKTPILRNPLREKEIQKMLFLIDSSRGRYLSAIDHLQKQQFLSDSLFTEASNHQIQELQIQYDTKRKDQELLANSKNLRLMSDREILQAGVIQKTKVAKNLALGALALLIIIIGLLYYLYYTKRKTNKNLEIQHKHMAKLVNEKDWLLKEIHHRVKNNLHTITGLLDSQSMFLKTEEAQAAIRESQYRLAAMSIIHQKLYQSENMSATDMSVYIHELVEYLKDCFWNSKNIHFNLQIARIEFDLSYSIPLALILNEAITNAIKYAFPGNRDGRIEIVLYLNDDNQYHLSISDNGIGLPADFNAKTNYSMGINLMRGLSEDINSSFNIIRSQGTQIDLHFTYNVPHREIFKI